MTAPIIPVHLLTRSPFDGGSFSTHQLLNKCQQHDMDAVALVDRGYLHGVPEFFNRAKRANINPIVGCEVFPEGHILLSMNSQGYRNLIRISSFIGTEVGPSGFDREALRDMLLQYHEGLIIIVSVGKVTAKVIAVRETILSLHEVFGDRMYCALRPSGPPGQQPLAESVLCLACDIGIPPVAVHEVRYMELKDAKFYSILRAVQAKNKFYDQDVQSLEIGGAYHFKTPGEMRQDFSFCPEALANTIEIAKRCQLESLELPTPSAPWRPVPTKRRRIRCGRPLGEVVKNGLSRPASRRFLRSRNTGSGF